MSDKLTLEEAQECLMVAAKNGDAETVAEMLAVRGIDVNKTDVNGATPLHAAVDRGYPEIVKLLLAVRGIDVNKVYSGWAPLHAAADSGYTEIVKLLLAVRGIDVNKADNNGRTPLRAADNPEIIELLKVAEV